MADRNDPMVQAWIDEYTRLNDTKHEDCRLCGWPHASNMLCNTATFGAAVIGGQHYWIKKNNVDSFLNFRRKSPARGFHWRDDILRRLARGWSVAEALIPTTSKGRKLRTEGYSRRRRDDSGRFAPEERREEALRELQP